MSLLQTVLASPELLEKFGRLPTDFKTIEMNVTQDIDLSDAGRPSEDTIPLGFVPHRHVETLAERKHEDADYRIVGRLGSGGMSIVYQAHQRAIDREVALKVLRDELAAKPFSRQRFLTEAKVIGGLDHPNVIALHEVCVDSDGRLLYSMKRVDGTSWDKRMSEMTLEQNLDTLLHVADAVRYAHSRGLIHRDIKPENVMLGRFGEVLVADWGLAVTTEACESGSPDSIGGTPAYMAPELAAAQPYPISTRSDVYLLGATLFHVLTGLPPHDGESLLSCIQAAAKNQIRPTDVEGELMEIAIKAMATHPEDRFQNVEAFIEAIKDQRQHDESTRLARRACESISEGCQAKRYEDFRLAEALLAESLVLWPDNARALQMRHRLQVEFARTATQRGDLEMALSLYELAGETESEAAAEVREMLQVREASQQRVSRYSTLFMQSPQAGMLIDVDSGTVVEANQKFANLLGYSEVDLIGRPIAELDLFQCPQQRVELARQLRAHGTLNDFEAALVHSDGHAIDMLINSRIVDVDGTEMAVSTFQDISKRKRAERQLQTSRQRLRDLQQLAGLGTWSFDVNTGELTWSDEAFALAGRRVEEGVPTREEYLEMIHPDDRDRLKEAFRATVESGAAYELFVRQKGAGGQFRNVLMRGQPILDDQGNTVEVYGVVIPQRS
jgi:PAS domain S-box-containing protein